MRTVRHGNSTLSTFRLTPSAVRCCRHAGHPHTPTRPHAHTLTRLTRPVTTHRPRHRFQTAVCGLWSVAVCPSFDGVVVDGYRPHKGRRRKEEREGGRVVPLPARAGGLLQCDDDIDGGGSCIDEGRRDEVDYRCCDVADIPRRRRPKVMTTATAKSWCITVCRDSDRNCAHVRVVYQTRWSADKTTGHHHGGQRSCQDSCVVASICCETVWLKTVPCNVVLEKYRR